MTDEMMNLRELLEKSPDTDLLREMIGFASQRLVELEVGGLTGATYLQNLLRRFADFGGIVKSKFIALPKHHFLSVRASNLVAEGYKSCRQAPMTAALELTTPPAIHKRHNAHYVKRRRPKTTGFPPPRRRTLTLVDPLAKRAGQLPLFASYASSKLTAPARPALRHH